MRRFTIWLVMLVALTGTTTLAVPSDKSAKEAAFDVTSRPSESNPVVMGANKLGLDMLRLLANSTKYQHKNILISPVSIEMALSMTYSGAKGATAQEMARVLGVDKQTIEQTNKQNQSLLNSWNSLATKDKATRLYLANSLWTKIVLLPDFVVSGEKYYQSELTTLDLSAPDAAPRINSWVSTKTANMIKNLVTPDVVARSNLVLVNCVYFKGKWTVPFDKQRTKPMPFMLLQGGSKSVPMMLMDGDFDYYESPELQAVKLPYGQGHIAAYALLPAKGKSFKEFVDVLTDSKLEEVTSRLTRSEGQVGLPRTHLEFGTASVKEPLIALGMKLPFGTADFSGMAKGGELKIGDVLHKASMDVDEEGTTAAAATAVLMFRGGATVPRSRFKMIIDRPYILLLRDTKNGAILFVAAVANPD